MHSSRMRTAHLLPISPSMHFTRRSAPWGCIPVGCIPPTCYLYLPACTALGGMLPGGVCSWGLCIPAYSMHEADTPPREQNDSQTGVKTQLSQTLFAGGNNWEMIMPREATGLCGRLVSEIYLPILTLTCLWTSANESPELVYLSKARSHDFKWDPCSYQPAAYNLKLDCAFPPPPTIDHFYLCQ